MPDTPNPKPDQSSRGGRHYPGRSDLDRANADLRRQIAKVFRDRDPNTSVKAAGLVAEVVAAIDAVTAMARKAQQESAVHQAQMRRLEENLARLGRKAARSGRPLRWTAGTGPSGDNAA
ncbi:hypothetical protein OG535_13280 [Kitasatospora sp. NBC_00085]|uniref:hypothetical protein n=1 Tax=Kitasatospora sp. NBC_00085 TaxID=2903566 RepID=UPI003246C074